MPSLFQLDRSLPFIRSHASSLLMAAVSFQVASVACAANLHDFMEYKQEVSVTFASPDEADQAQMTPLPLPDGAKVGFTTRWDDCNPEHLKTLGLLGKYGMSGTVMLNPCGPQYVQSLKGALQASGSAIGNHSLTHPLLANSKAPAIYEQIVMNQPVIESAFDMPSVSFVLPGSYAGFQTAFVGESLRRAGILASPEADPRYATWYGFPEDSLAMTIRINTRDEAPDPEAARRNAQEAVVKAEQTPAIARVTFGMHSWFNKAPDGWQRLEACLAALQKHGDWWYCNENEFGAYRYSYFHASPVKRTSGNTATFTLTRISAADLGSEIPLDVRFSITPKVVSVDSVVLAPSGGGIYKIPCVGHVPAKIDFLHDTTVSSKFSGLTMSLGFDADANTLGLTVTNATGSALENVVVSFKAPLKWKKGTYLLPVGNLASGADRAVAIDLGALDDRPETQAGSASFLARMDFESNGVAARVYVACSDENTNNDQKPML